MAEMEHHVRAAVRAKPRALLAADLPYRSYETVESAVANAKRLVAAGAEAVKAEGGRKILPQVRAIIAVAIAYTSFYTKARREESFLSQEFGPKFAEHQRHTGMFLPSFG